jgi:hypothetical protein
MSGGAPVDVHVDADTAPATGPLLEVRDLRVHFDHGGRRICDVDGLSYALSVGAPWRSSASRARARP